MNNIIKGIFALLLSHMIFTYYNVNKIYLIPETYNAISPIIQEKINTYYKCIYTYIYNIHDDKKYTREELNDITTIKQNEIILTYIESIRKEIIVQAKKGYYRLYWSDKSMVLTNEMLNKITDKLKELFPNTEIKKEYGYTNVIIQVDWT
jgi:hypothetical protein